MKYLTLFFLFVTSATANAIEKCGSYEVEGFLTKKESGTKTVFSLIVAKNTASQVVFDFDTINPSSDLKEYVGSNVRLHVLIKKPCRFNCMARVEKLLHALDPFEEPKSFLFPKPKPISEVPCEKL